MLADHVQDEAAPAAEGLAARLARVPRVPVNVALIESAPRESLVTDAAHQRRLQPGGSSKKYEEAGRGTR